MFANIFHKHFRFSTFLSFANFSIDTRMFLKKKKKNTYNVILFCNSIHISPPVCFIYNALQ